MDPPGRYKESSPDNDDLETAAAARLRHSLRIQPAHGNARANATDKSSSAPLSSVEPSSPTDNEITSSFNSEQRNSMNGTLSKVDATEVKSTAYVRTEANAAVVCNETTTTTTTTTATALDELTVNAQTKESPTLLTLNSQRGTNQVRGKKADCLQAVKERTTTLPMISP